MILVDLFMTGCYFLGNGLFVGITLPITKGIANGTIMVSLQLDAWYRASSVLVPVLGKEPCYYGVVGFSDVSSFMK